MTPFLCDLLALLVLGFCIWQGYRKGLVLMVISVVIIILSVWGASTIASKYSEQFSEKLQPLLSWVSEDPMDKAARGKGNVNNITDQTALREIAQETFVNMGISEKRAVTLTGLVFEGMGKPDMTFRKSVSSVFMSSISYVILAVFGFIVLMILLTLVMHFIAAVFKLPVLKTLDSVGGAALGLLFGMLILAVFGWALQFTGALIPQEVISKTWIMKLFSNWGIISGMLSLK